ncbi:MAG: RHS repeat domain-containing protein, partial [Gammaproteobacteria bacterium]
APYAYSAGRFETGLTNGARQGETRVYDARFGTVSTLTGPNNLSTNWQYDSFGRKILETRADGTSTQWAYGLCNKGNCPANVKYSVTQTPFSAPPAMGLAPTTVYYDILDREVRTQTIGVYGFAIWKDTVYDGLGRVDHVSRPYYQNETPYWIYYTYDALNRVTSVSLPTPAGSTPTIATRTAYNGLTTTVTTYRDGLALTTTQVKDAIGELVSVTDANNNITRYAYDPFGNLTTVTDPALNVTSMTYDIRGRKLSMTDPDMGNWQYSYNSVGELTQQIDANGQTVIMSYDSLGRMYIRNEAEGITIWIYDDTTLSGPAAKGKLSQVIWPGGTRTFVYDQFGRPAAESTSLSGGRPYTLSWTYDAFSRLETTTYPGGFSVYNTYFPYSGYLHAVTDGATGINYWVNPGYTADGQVTNATLGNNLTTVNQYDPATGLITGISTGVGLSGSATQYLTYRYDTLGNLKQRQDGIQTLTEVFWLDKLNRLQQYYVNANGTITASQTLAYDSIGNITSKSDVGSYSYDPLHIHAVKTAGSGSYTYDANGNQKTGPNGRRITYTSFNQPLSLTQGGKTNSFVYDGDHQRVMETTSDGTTITIHPRIDLGAHYEEVHKANGTVEYKNYIYAGKDVIAVYTTRSNNVNDTRYFHKDHLGSIDTITNETGQVVERLSYDAWGKRRNGNWTDATTAISSITHHGFTGHEHLDDVGLINMNGRIYDPTLGRFLSADPTVQSPGNPQTLNRYTYANNNPLSYTDPSGFSLKGWLVDTWHSIERNPIVRAVAAIALGYLTFGYVGFLTSSPWIGGFAGGFVGGFVGSGGNLQAGLYGGITGAVFAGIGQYADMKMTGVKGDPWGFGGTDRVIAHAMGGGITSVVQGQKFMSGFVAAGAGEWVGLGPPKGVGDFAYKMTASAVIGGTASVIGGGKFENGAKTAAYGYLYNEAASYGVNNFSKLGATKLDARQWTRVADTSLTNGDSLTVAAGSTIAIEIHSDAFPPTEEVAVSVYADPSNQNGYGNVASPGWFKPVIYTAQVGQVLGIPVTTTYVIDTAVPGSYNWTVSIRSIGETHDNTQNQGVYIYVPK